MTPPLTYAEFLVVFLGPPIAALLALTWGRLSQTLVSGAAIVGVVGLVYTTPWDNALIDRGVWWYAEGAVWARLYLAPIEEYAFVLLQTALSVLWVGLLRSRWGATGGSPADTPGAAGAGSFRALSWRSRAAGGGAGLLVGLVGVGLLSSRPTFYVGAILAWAGPVLAVQWAFGWTHLWRNRRLAALAIGAPTAYLAVADRIAIDLGIWSLSTRYTTGLHVAGLPVEEGAFFLFTNAFVVQGVLLFLWVAEGPATAGGSPARRPTLEP